MAERCRQALAARNNADLCDAVCRTHGLEPHLDAEVWTSSRRTPTFYPDAISLVAEPDARSMLVRIDNSPGASVKDSFAALDLVAFGYSVLFEARWIAAEPGSVSQRAESQWSVAATAAEFAHWERAWRGEDGPVDVLRPELMRDERITIIGAHSRDEIVAGAILNRSTDVIGISNAFAGPDCDPSEVFRFATQLFPDMPFVGYESGDALDAALALGFRDVGGLRVWTRND